MKLEHTDSAGCETPRILVNKFLFLRFWVLEHDFKHFWEVLSQMMRCSSLDKDKIIRLYQNSYWQKSTVAPGFYLDASSAGSNESLDRGSEITTRKLFFLRFASFYHWDSQQIGVDFAVEV